MRGARGVAAGVVGPVLLAALLVVHTAAQGGRRCPTTCRQAHEWCDDQFGRGGSVVAGACDDTAAAFSTFECVCNGAAIVHVRRLTSDPLQCVWSAPFQRSPNGIYCTAGTGQCPLDCANASLLMQMHGEDCSSPMTCNVNGSVVTAECDTCHGQTYTVQTTVDGENATACEHSFARPLSWCDSVQQCNGHGCCQSTGNGAQVCNCYRDDERGHWVGDACSDCHPLYLPVATNPTCLKRRSVSTEIVLSLGPSAMVLPLLFSVVIIVGLLIVRRKWVSDEEVYQLPARLPYNNNRQFKSKMVPKRPDGSRGMVNRAERARQDAIRKGLQL